MQLGQNKQHSCCLLFANTKGVFVVQTMYEDSLTCFSRFIYGKAWLLPAYRRYIRIFYPLLELFLHVQIIKMLKFCFHLVEFLFLIFSAGMLHQYTGNLGKGASFLPMLFHTKKCFLNQHLIDILPKNVAF